MCSLGLLLPCCVWLYVCCCFLLSLWSRGWLLLLRLHYERCCHFLSLSHTHAPNRALTHSHLFVLCFHTLSGTVPDLSYRREQRGGCSAPVNGNPTYVKTEASGAQCSPVALYYSAECGVWSPPSSPRVVACSSCDCVDRCSEAEDAGAGEGTSSNF